MEPPICIFTEKKDAWREGPPRYIPHLLSDLSTEKQDAIWRVSIELCCEAKTHEANGEEGYFALYPSTQNGWYTYHWIEPDENTITWGGICAARAHFSAKGIEYRGFWAFVHSGGILPNAIFRFVYPCEVMKDKIMLPERIRTLEELFKKS
jgi:hypothetical protein